MKRIAVFLVAIALPVIAETAAHKRPLRHSDYDSWNSISSQTLSRDGKYLAYALFPQEGDGALVVRNLTTGAEVRKSVGALPPPPDANEENPDAPPPVRGIRISITSDQKYVVATTFPSKKETDEAKKARKSADQMPRNGLIILEIASGQETRIADVLSMQVPENGGAWVAWRRGSKAAAPAGAARDEYGSDLVLRNLATGAERTFEDAVDYWIAKDGKTLVWSASSRKEETNGVYAFTPGASGPPTALLSGKGSYGKPVWDRLERQIAFVASQSGGTKFRAYLWKRASATPPALIDAAVTGGLQDGYGFADKGQISFSWDGSRVYFPVMTAAALARAHRKPAAAPGGEEKVLADLWHWKDDYVQPIQKIRATQERNRTYRAVYHIEERKLLQVAGPDLPAVVPSDSGRYAIGSDDRRYRPMLEYDGSYADLWLVDTATGRRQQLLEKFRGGASWSPKGDYALVFRDREWWTIKAPEGALTNISAALGVKVYDERFDSPAEPPAYGNGGWLSDGSGVLLYDAYDVWLVSPDGKTRRRLTRGREDNVQYRAIRVEPAEEAEDQRGVDPGKPLYLRAESEQTRESGIFRLANLGTGAAAGPARLIWGPKNYRVLGKAKEADVVLLTASTFAEEPDLQVTDSNFRTPKKVTEANPQRASLLWGTGELLDFRNADGVPLQAALYKPEKFDPKKKYPLLVYIYERLSQNVNNFTIPRPSNGINFPYYVSNGYLILTPDIVYTTGSPGQSALKCVLPAIDELVKLGYVDESRIGIQGHSWGGYQIAYMLTRTTRFRAAEAGAPVGNMTSAYNGIRWGSGLPRQFQYEKTQSRIGATLWDNPLDFIENSPVFRANRITTPVLILHDDDDDAVPWTQGIEFFLSLRRNGKEAYLFNYNGEKHNLRKRHNQKDFAVRMQQFFDFFLKDAPKPEWMEKGIPWLEREDEKKKFSEMAYPRVPAASENAAAAAGN